MLRNRTFMEKYLTKETRYTIEELNKLDDETIRQWHREEREVNRI